MKFFEPRIIQRTGTGGKTFFISITKPAKILGWKFGDEVNVSIPNGHIEIRKKEEPKKAK